MIKQRICLCGICILNMFLLSSCISFNAIPELSEEDEKKVVTYMADAVLQYETSYKSDLLDEKGKVKASEEIEKKKEKLEKTLQDEQERKEREAAERENRDIEQTQAVKTNTIEDLASVMGLDGQIEIDYLGYELMDKYPQVEDEVLHFSIQPKREDAQILLLQFNIANISGEDIPLDMIKMGISYRGVVNDSKYPTLNSFLNEDLSTYGGTIPVESGEELYLFVEIPKDIEIESLGIYTIDSQKNTMTITL